MVYWIFIILTIMKRNILLASLLSLSVAYPLYKQCSPAWGANALGYSGGRTICQSGCLISSVSMVLNDCQISLPLGPTKEANSANPGTINSWLKENDGFEDGYGFKWNSTKSLGLEWEKFSSNATELREAHDANKRIFLHVRHDNHYVLMTGYSVGATPEESLFYINDPAFDTDAYTAAEVEAGNYTSIFTLNETLTCKTNSTKANLSREVTFLY
ncbi:hypothetical protein FGO68_gene17193 [Halteria grandinella]|uniref:Peptidase C39-like domain-containing protein n=1 Tax=Halteria grandinella TaxID=5974 RepID=A0A8J8NI58_HALGN|nr:hypothetical protein FGO68_gene17193 [Halteria grandinella]